MDDLFRMLVLRAPQPAESATTVPLPMGEPTDLQLALANARNQASEQRQQVAPANGPRTALDQTAVVNPRAVVAQGVLHPQVLVPEGALNPPATVVAMTVGHGPHPQRTMWALAEEFATGPTFLADATTLPLAPKLKDFGAKLAALTDPTGLNALGAAVQQSFGKSPAQLVAGADFVRATQLLGDALVAAVLTPQAHLRDPDQYVLFLRLFALIARIAAQDTTLTKAGAIAAALSAHVLLPPSIFPVDPTMIQPLGVADDWVVRQHTARYELGEIALVENVLQGENRAHATKHTLTTQQTSIIETEKTTETLKDVQATDRFDLKSEVDSTLKEDTSVKGGVTVKYDSAPWTVTANVEAAYQRSKSDSTKVATEQARDVVQRASTKVTDRIRQQQTTQITETFADDTNHSFDNTHGTHHVTGIYQWVNKVLRVQMFDLGPRQIFDIMVPEPAALIWDLRQQPPPGDVPTAPIPFTAEPSSLSVGSLGFPGTIGPYLSAYGVTGVPAPPADHLTVSAAYDDTKKDGNDSNGMVQAAVLTLPSGYGAVKASVNVTMVTDDPPDKNVYFAVEFGSGSLGFKASDSGSKMVDLGNEEGSLAIGIDALHLYSYAVAIDVHCILTAEARAAWQLQVHDVITQAYLQRVKEYEEKVAAKTFQASATAMPARNPDRNRDIERTELKRQAIALLAGPVVDLLQFDGLLPNPFIATGQNYPRPNPARAEAEGRIARFFEQALEWENMNYFFYPYYWGRSDTWYQRVLADDDDPLFADFLRAGQARIVVPVRKGFECDIQCYVTSGGQLWGRAPLPDVHAPDYLSIAKEIEAAQHPELGSPGDWWETTLPTNQVCLRGSPTLPCWQVDDKWQWTPVDVCTEDGKGSSKNK